MPRHLRTSFVAIVVLAVLAPVGLRGEEPRVDAVSTRMREFVEQGRISGAVTLVAHGGKVVHLSADGRADLEADRPMQPDTMFAIASMTKPITATALMILVDEGKLSLDDPVAKHLPEFANVEIDGHPSRQPLLVRHLLMHTNGVTSDQRNRGPLAETVSALAKQPLAFEPGSKWQYGPGLTVAGRIVEVVSKQPFEEFLQQRVFEPLGMRETTFFPTDEQRARLAKLYKPGEAAGTLVPGEHWITEQAAERTPNPSGGLYSTADDLFRFYQAILNGGELDGKRILSADAVRTMASLQTGDLVTGFTPGNGWGIGWCVIREPQGVSKTLSPGTFGHGGAFGTQGWVDPKTGTVYVLLIQRTEFGNSDGSEIRAAFHELAAEALPN